MRTTITMDDGVQFGLGAFETIAVERGKGILLSRHLARLGRSAQFLGLGRAGLSTAAHLRRSS